MVMTLATYVGTTGAFFVDDELSSDDSLGFGWGLTTLNDGFEGSPWDDNWDENGSTVWLQSSAQAYSGTYAASGTKTEASYLTSDDLFASSATNITIHFWYRPSSIEAGDILFQAYNGTAYNTLYDLLSYPTYADNTWCEFSEVINDSQYFIAGFRIRFNNTGMTNNNDAVWIDDVLVITDSIPPAAPTNLVATLGEEQVSLDWDNNSENDIDGYNVYRSLTSGSGYSKINGSLVENSDYLDTGLTNNTTYYYVVTAVDLGNNESSYSNEDYATPTDLPPSAPTGLEATAGEEEVELDWNDNTESDIDGYNVYRSTTSGSGYSKINTGLVATSNYTDTGLTNDVTYYYVVTAVDLSAFESSMSSEANATPTDLPPDIPTSLVATPGDKKATLDWVDNTDTDLDGYNVYRSTTSGSGYSKINTGLVATSNYTDTGLTGGITYYYVVTAVDLGANESGYSNEDDATPTDPAPSPPTGLTATAGDRQASLDWNDNSEGDLAGYNVYRSLTSGSGYSKINSSLVSASNYTDTDLNGGTTYYYVVTAVDLASHESAYSAQDDATPYDLAPAAPTGLNTTPGNNEIALDWNDNSETDLDGYNVYRSTTSGTGYSKVNTGLVLTSNYTDTGLSANATYYYVVTAVDLASNESSYSTEESEIPNDPVPSDPTGLTATAGDLEANLDWDDNIEEDLAGYNVYRSLTSGSGYTKVNGSPVGTSYYTDTGLNSTVTYFYVVTAVDYGNGESGYSNEDFATPTDPPPAAPTGLTATPHDSEIELDWDDNSESDLDGYNVYRSITSGSGYSKINGSLIETSNYTDYGVTNNVTYYYVVTAVDITSSESSSTSEVSATPDPAPSAPTGLTATAGDKQASLDWNDNSEGDLDGYNIYRSLTSGSGYSKLNDALITSSNFTDTGLTGGTTYYYVVTAVDQIDNESGYSNEDNATPYDNPPAAPTGLAATAGDKQVSLDWNDNTEEDLDGYNVYRSLTSGSGYSKINTGLVSTSNYTDTGLVGGTTYYYVVTAVDLLSNESSYSAEDNATPTDPAPSAPTGLDATSGYKQVSLDWNDNSEEDLDGYNVYRSLTSGSGYSKINGSLVYTSNYTDTGLTGGTTYYYVVTAVDLASNESSYSAEDSAVPTDPPPVAPTGLAAAAGYKQVSLDWNDNTEEDLDGYNVYRSLTSGSGYTKINSLLLETSDYTDTDLSPAYTYYYVVTAVDIESNSSGYSAESSSNPYGKLMLTDGFEGSPFDLQWNDNGTTVWTQVSNRVHTGSYAARGRETEAGYLTTDDIDASDSTGITVNFWLNPQTAASDCLVEAYNGTAWNTLYDLTTYPGYSADTWSEFNEEITDSQYFVYNFRLRFNNTAMSAGNDAIWIDDVIITTDSTPPLSPTGLDATAGEEQVELDWNDNSESDLDGYNVYRSTTSGSGYSKVNGSVVSTSNYTDTGLTNNTTYYYVVTALDIGSNESGYSLEDYATPQDFAPAAPTGLAATAGEEQVELDWNDNSESDLDGYNVYRSTTSGSGYSKVNTGLVSTSNYTDTGLTNGTTYYYVVTAVDLTSHESSYSNEDYDTPTDVNPAAPTGLAATPGDKQVSLDWNDNSESDLAGYNVYRSLTSGFGYSKINTGLVSTSNYTDTGLTGNVTYYYVVTAVDDGANESEYSSEDNATPTDAAPSAPTGLAATPGDKQVSLDWNDNGESDLDGYNVYRSLTSGSGYSKVNTSLVASSNYTDTGLTGGTTYYYVVRAVDQGSNESTDSNEDSATPTDAAPSSPTGLTATPGDRQVSLDWNDNSEEDLDGYNVYRSLTSGSGYSKVNTSVVETSDYIDTGLTGNVTYYYVVRAVDQGSNESTDSNEDSATPTDPAPSAPTGLAGTPGDALASLDWNDNTEDDLDGYNVYRSLTSGSGYSKINTSLVETSNYLDTGLTGNVTYYYVVTAVDLASHESSYSTEESVTPTDPPPSAPAGLFAVPHDAQVELNWTDNSETDLDGYNVYRSTTSGSGYGKLNGALVETSNYTDNSVTNDVTYYYIVTAVDTMSGESDNSTEVNATPNATPSPPSGLTATSGDKQISLDWNDNGEGDIAGYNVYRSIISGSGYSKINTGLVGTSDYTDTNLPGGVTYYYVVTAVDTIANESGYSGEDSATPTDSIPSAPTGLAATPGDKQVSLDWNDNTEGDLDGYNVYRSLTSGSGYSKINTVLLETSNYLDTGLTGNVTYYYVVTAVDLAAQESGYSSEDSATPTDPAPSAPTGLAGTPGDKQASLDWNDNTEEDLDGYNIYRSTTSGSGYSQINGSLLETSDYTVTGLTGNVTYYYVVTAVDLAAHESSYSAEESVTPTDAPPAAPTGLVATPHDAEVDLDWADNSEGDFAGYNVYRSTTSGSGYSKLNGSLLTSSNYTDNSVSNDTTYYYVVTAVDLGSNESSYSSEDNATPNATPAAPTSLVATGGDLYVDLDWADNSEGDIAGYNVYRSTTSGSGYSKINASLVTISAYTDDTVSNDITYYYVVTAIDTIANESSYSAEDNATPTGLTLINDGFEVDPWYDNWDGNGGTTWTQRTNEQHSGSYSARGRYDAPGDLTSDDLDASTAVYNIYIEFWYYPRRLDGGEALFQVFNGSTWDTLYDMNNGANNNWNFYSTSLTGSQYFISNFKIKFNGTALADNDVIFVDDVLVQTNQ